MKLPSFLRSFFDRIAAGFSTAAHAALEAVKNLNITDALQQAAIDAVRAAEAAGGTGEQKFNAAFAAVQRSFGYFAKGAIQTAIQIAWGSLFGGK